MNTDVGDIAAFVVSPHVIDVILGLTVVEAVVLLVLAGRRRAGQSGVAGRVPTGFDKPGRVRGVGLMLLPGVCLMLAIRAALAGAAWPWVPAALAAAGVAHLLDLRGRWRG